VNKSGQGFAAGARGDGDGTRSGRIFIGPINSANFPESCVNEWVDAHDVKSTITNLSGAFARHRAYSPI